MFDVLKVGCWSGAAMFRLVSTGPDVVSGSAIKVAELNPGLNARIATKTESQCTWRLDTEQPLSTTPVDGDHAGCARVRSEPARTFAERLADFECVIGLPRFHASKPHVGAAAVNGTPPPAADVVARAVLIAAQERSAFLHALGDARLLRIHAVARAARIARDALGVELREIVGTIPVGTPLPDISADIV